MQVLTFLLLFTLPLRQNTSNLLTLYLYIAMPDALSKTVPIWSAVMNRALFPDETTYHVQFLPGFLGRSEETQIEAKIDSFVASFKVREETKYYISFTIFQSLELTYLLCSLPCIR